MKPKIKTLHCVVLKHSKPGKRLAGQEVRPGRAYYLTPEQVAAWKAELSDDELKHFRWGDAESVRCRPDPVPSEPPAVSKAASAVKAARSRQEPPSPEPSEDKGEPAAASEPAAPARGARKKRSTRKKRSSQG